MIGLGLRLAVAGGREAVSRLVIIAAAVALGTGLLLATLAGINAVDSQNARYAWLNTGNPSTTVAVGQAAPQGTDPAWWVVRGDYYDGQDIGRVDVAATGPDSPVPPGIPALPGPGEYYASPALTELLASTPADQLADRYPGHRIGTIGRAALPAPNSLIIIIGYTPEQLAGMPDAHRVTSIASVTPSHCSNCFVGVRSSGMDLILSVVAGALLFPVLLFIGAATRLTAARREQRFAALRLVGGTPRQVSVISAVESTAAAVAGVVLGFGLYAVIHDPIAAIPFTGSPFYPADLSLSLVDVLAVALGVPVGAALSARIALSRVRVSPLGVTRRVTPRPPRAYRLIPLVLGIGDLAYFIGRRPPTSNGQVVAFLPAFLVIMAGLVIAGPWFTMVGARLLARRARRAATLVAARRLADNPKAAFRAISGLVIALFVTSVAVGVITTIVANRAPQAQRTGTPTTLTLDFWSVVNEPGAPTSVPGAVTTRLPAVSGVRSVTVVRHNPADIPRFSGPGQPQVLPGLVACADLARDPSFGRCADGAEVATVWTDLADDTGSTSSLAVWPAAPVSLSELARLPVLTVVVGTDGSTGAVEQARTALENAYPGSSRPPSSQVDFNTDFNNTLTGWRQLANVVILASLPIAGCGLAVSVAGGISERKRPFSLLRLSGVPLRVLRRVVVLESAVPLLLVALVAIGTGLLAAQLFLKAQLGYTLRPLGVGYYVTVLAGLVASLGIIASTLPLLERLTGPETARND